MNDFQQHAVSSRHSPINNPLPTQPPPQDSRLNQRPQPAPRPLARNGFTKPPMQAFDPATIAALAKSRGAFITDPVATLEQPLSQIKLEPSVESNSLDIAATLAAALDSKESAIGAAASKTESAAVARESALGAAAIRSEPPAVSRESSAAAIKTESAAVGMSALTSSTETSDAPVVKNGNGKNPISALYERGQINGIRPEFIVLDQSGPSHQPR